VNRGDNCGDAVGGTSDGRGIADIPSNNLDQLVLQIG
jgi:hypothetical protein